MSVDELVAKLLAGDVSVLPVAGDTDLDNWPQVMNERAADPGVTCLVQEPIEHPADQAFLAGPLARQPFKRWWVDLCHPHRHEVQRQIERITT